MQVKRPTRMSKPVAQTLWDESTKQERAILRACLRALRAAKPDEYSALKTTIHTWDIVTRRRRKEEALTQ
jgi:hypothetical protein